MLQPEQTSFMSSLSLSQEFRIKRKKIIIKKEENTALPTFFSIIKQQKRGNKPLLYTNGKPTQLVI